MSTSTTTTPQLELDPVSVAARLSVRLDAVQLDLVALVDRLSAALTERDAEIAQLKAELDAQRPAQAMADPPTTTA